MSQGGKVDYVIVDEARFLATEQIDQLARVVKGGRATERLTDALLTLWGKECHYRTAL